MTYAKIQYAAAAVGLDLIGGFHPNPQDRAPKNCQTLLLFGPQEPGFWARITESPEYQHPDPVDMWSKRVLENLAQTHNATALFPFGGPPYLPFIAWALRTGRIWSSPVQLLVHERMGLMLSIRGALALPENIPLPSPPLRSPCESCADKPCQTACPANALSAQTYDLGRCHSWLAENRGRDCLFGGCTARRSCPIGQTYGRLAVQSAHHMRAFHKG